MNFQDNRPLYLQVEASIRNDIREKKNIFQESNYLQKKNYVKFME